MEKYDVVYESATFGMTKAQLTQAELAKLLCKRGVHLTSVNANTAPYIPKKRKKGK